MKHLIAKALGSLLILGAEQAVTADMSVIDGNGVNHILVVPEPDERAKALIYAGETKVTIPKYCDLSVNQYLLFQSELATRPKSSQRQLMELNSALV
jgi:hypothetical protein